MKFFVVVLIRHALQSNLTSNLKMFINQINLIVIKLTVYICLYINLCANDTDVLCTVRMSEYL